MSDPIFDILAFDIGGTHGRCALARHGTGGSNTIEFGEILSLRREARELGPAWMETLIAGANGVLERAGKPVLQRCAVSFGGPVLPDGSVQSTHVPGWERVDLIGGLVEAFQLRRENVRVENDANAGALGEFTYGAGRGCRDMLFFTVSTGIGGGVILDGKLRRGTHGLAGEFGHMIMDGLADAPQYAAGKPGALEALASGPALEREGRAALARIGRTTPASFAAKDVFDAARIGEPWAIEARTRCVGALGRGVAVAVCAYDVERVVIGGGVSQAGDAMFVPLRAAVELYLPSYFARKVLVVPAELGDSAPLYGAVAAMRAD